MAAMAVRSIRRRMDRGETITAQLSPARTAKLLTDMDARPVSTPLVPKGDRNLSPVAIRAFASGRSRRNSGVQLDAASRADKRVIRIDTDCSNAIRLASVPGRMPMS